MKLRVKLPDSTAVTRVELPDASRLDDLAQAVLQGIGLQGVDATKLQFSLNKKSAISNDPNALLSSLGLCSGDTLWLKLPDGADVKPGPDTTSTAPGAQEAASKRTRTKERATAAMDVDAHPPQPPAAPSTSSAAAAAAAPQQPTLLQPPPASSATPAPAAATAVGCDDEHMTDVQGQADLQADDDVAELTEHHVQQEVVNTTPGHLARTFSAWHLAVRTPTTPTITPRHARHQVLLLAVHAAMQEAGFTLRQPTATSAAATTQQQPVSGAGPTATTTTTTAGTTAAKVTNGTQPLAQELLFPASGVATLQYQFLAAGGLTATAAADNAALATPSCSLRAVVMGPHLLVHASVQPAVSGAPHGAPGTQQKARIISLTLDTRQEVDVSKVEEAASSVVGAGQAAVGGAANSTVLNADMLINLRGLWIMLQDQLAAWCITTSCAAVGLPAPRGLLSLPSDIKHVILAQLQALDLARLSSVCVELRHLASQDAYWETLLTRDFPGLPNHVRLAAARHGFKAGYAAAWKDRKERERRMQLYRHLPRHPMPMFPGVGPFPSLPGRLHQPPGIIGGDYDRFPVMPGFARGGMFSGPTPNLLSAANAAGVHGWLGRGSGLPPGLQGRRGGLGGHGSGSFFG